MNKYLVYVKKFNKKQELTNALVEGKVYEAVDSGELMDITLDKDHNFLIHKDHQSGDLFDAEVVKITKENSGDFQYSKEDSEKVVEYIIKPIIQEAASEYNTRQDSILDKMNSSMNDLLMFDTEIAETISNVTSYVRSTFDDKYEADEIPAVDLYGLMRNSPHGKGFNVGQATAYLKRYLTDGYEKSNNILDLYKAIHYLMFEISRVNNSGYDKKD